MAVTPSQLYDPENPTIQWAPATIASVVWCSDNTTVEDKLTGVSGSLLTVSGTLGSVSSSFIAVSSSYTNVSSSVSTSLANLSSSIGSVSSSLSSDITNIYNSLDSFGHVTIYPSNTTSFGDALNAWFEEAPLAAGVRDVLLLPLPFSTFVPDSGSGPWWFFIDLSFSPDEDPSGWSPIMKKLNAEAPSVPIRIRTIFPGQELSQASYNFYFRNSGELSNTLFVVQGGGHLVAHHMDGESVGVTAAYLGADATQVRIDFEITYLPAGDGTPAIVLITVN